MGGMGGMVMGAPAADGAHARQRQRHAPSSAAQIQADRAGRAADLQAQREAGRALREQARQLFAQPTVDARAAEALRQQMLAQHDQASKRMLQAMLDISRVLTPEQRKQMAERMSRAPRHDAAPPRRARGGARRPKR